jgi:hypothetical protein
LPLFTPPNGARKGSNRLSRTCFAGEDLEVLISREHAVDGGAGAQRKPVTIVAGEAELEEWIGGLQDDLVAEDLLSVGRIAPRDRLREAVVDVSPRIRRQRDRLDEVGEGVHRLCVQGAFAPEQRVEGGIEGLEVAPIAAPVEGLEAPQAPERLRRHRALHRIEGGSGGRDGAESQPWLHAVRQQAPGGIPEIPREAVEACEDMTRRARLVAVARAGSGVVEEMPPLADLRGAGVEERSPGDPDAADLLVASGVDDRDRVFEPAHHGAAAALIERDAARLRDVDRSRTAALVPSSTATFAEPKAVR